MVRICELGLNFKLFIDVVKFINVFNGFWMLLRKFFLLYKLIILVFDFVVKILLLGDICNVVFLIYFLFGVLWMYF